MKQNERRRPFTARGDHLESGYSGAIAEQQQQRDDRRKQVGRDLQEMDPSNGRRVSRETGCGDSATPAGAVGFTRLLGSRLRVYSTRVTFTIELGREADGRWLAEVPTLPGVLCYGQDRDEAVARGQALALRVIAERIEQREAPVEFLNVTFQAA
jgi:predicted RNase H-like HicB family nuclease